MRGKEGGDLPPEEEHEGPGAAGTGNGTQAAGAGVLRNTAAGLAAQATTSLFTAALTLYLARALGTTGFGVFSLALSAGSLVLIVSDFGVAQSAARFIAERHGDRVAVADVIAAALRLKLISAVAVSALMWALASPIAHAYGESRLVWPLRGVALALLGQTMLLLYLHTFAAARRVAFYARIVFVESLTETTASIALVALGAGTTGAAFGRATGYLVGALAGAVILRRFAGRRAFALRRTLPTGEVAGYAGRLVATNSAYALYSSIDSLLIGALLTARDVGLFAAPLRLVVFLGYVGESVAGAVAPRLARTEGHEPDATALRAALRWLILLQTLVLAPILVWAEPIVTLLLGHGFRGAAPVLRAMTPFFFLHGLSPLITVSVNYLGQAGRRIPIVLTALAVNVVVDVTLLPTIGVVGAAIGTSVAYAIYVPGHFRICRQALDIPLRPLARTLARGGLAAGAMALVLLALGTSHLSVVEWLVGLTGGTLAYFAVVLGTREVSLDEIGAVVGMARRRLAHA